MIMTMAMEETKIDEMRNYFLLTCSTNCLPLWMTTTQLFFSRIHQLKEARQHEHQLKKYGKERQRYG